LPVPSSAKLTHVSKLFKTMSSGRQGKMRECLMSQMGSEQRFRR
jgi:hypothetical protein